MGRWLHTEGWHVSRFWWCGEHGSQNSLVVEAAGGTGRARLLAVAGLVRGDDGLQVSSFATLLAAPTATIGGGCDLLGLVYGGLLDIGAIHFGAGRRCAVWASIGRCGEIGGRSGGVDCDNSTLGAVH